ncbi:MAG: family transposase [Geminicoccaceae bacterium]|nr:family transposase [Geminicoccaceae bacterium]
MPRAIALCPDLTATQLRNLARRAKDAAQARRLLAPAVIYDGGSRTEAARLGNVTLQIVRDWVLRFNAEGPDGLLDRKAPGPTPRLTDTHRAALAGIIDRGPIPAIHGPTFAPGIETRCALNALRARGRFRRHTGRGGAGWVRLAWSSGGGCGRHLPEHGR